MAGSHWRQRRTWHLVLLGTAVVLAGCHRTAPGESLRQASAAGHADEVNRILSRSPQAVDDPDLRTGMTPIEFAVITGNSAVVETLLVHGASPDRYDKLGDNAVYHAVREGKWPIIQLLLDHNAHVKDVRFGADRITPLMIAAHEGSRPVTEHLLALGVDPNDRDAGGRTAADYARGKHHDELAALIEKSMMLPTTGQTEGNRQNNGNGGH